MKRILLILIACVLFACDRNDVLESQETLQKEDVLEISNGRLKFSNKSMLNSKLKDLELRIWSSYIRKDFCHSDRFWI
ncbi:hypothetical protein [Labilibaculum euxinus]